MDEEDEVALKSINSKFPPGQEPMNEDQFEEVMSFFEAAAHTKQPYAAVDNPPVLPLVELEEHLDDTLPAYVKTYAKIVFDHWKTRRTETGNRGLAPHLKFETGQDTDDADPYVCFRRRELRQIRKTRNRDAQSAEKLRKLRLELETARDILQLVRTREAKRKDLLEIDRQVFEQRLAAKKTKRTLGIKGDDEDFVNQKVVLALPHNEMALTFEFSQASNDHILARINKYSHNSYAFLLSVVDPAMI
jgi:enhancer of polycomb-like protein